jgi:hypothetical protein
LEVASHQSRFVAVDASRANVNFKLPWINALRPGTDLSSAEWNSLMFGGFSYE